MKIEVDGYAAGTGVALRLSGELNADTFEQFTEAAAHQISGGFKIIVVDLGGVSYMSSAGIGALISVHDDVVDAGGKFALVRPVRLVMSVLQSVGLPSLISIFQDEADAVSALGLNPASGRTYGAGPPLPPGRDSGAGGSPGGGTRGRGRR